MVLLLFDPSNCPACESNWKYWNKLLADPEKGRLLIAVTGAPSIPPDYLKRHQINLRYAVTDLDAGMLKQMRMETVPQTILLESGVVKRVWFGLLSDDDVKEIAGEIQVED